MNKTMETLDIIGIQLGWLHWKNISCVFHYSIVCLRCIVPVSVHYRLCLVTVRMNVLQNGGLVRFSKGGHCWRAFSWSICDCNGHFIRCIQSSNLQGSDGIHKSYEGRWEEQWPKTKTKKESPYIEEDMSKNHRTTATKVTAELNIYLEDSVSSKTFRWELHKSYLHGTAAITKPLITENNS